jgi:pilus assembly protein FimV
MRALARWGITPLLAAPVGAWALGLGDIELESGLNQPFRARIGLSASTDELQGLRIALAGGETFARYGLDRPAFFNSFQFRVTTEANGSHSIRVSSAESIAEPFVTLLLEATWPRGRTLREYTVLLDPPVLLPAPAQPPAVRPAETRQPSSASPGGQITRPAPTSPASPPAPAPSPERPPAISSAPVPAPRESVELGGSYGPVQPAETLWAIAERLRPAGTSTNQMMIAVYEANPQAFGGNINLLRAGATLRLPEASALQAMAVTAANAEVQRQADAWRDRAATSPQQRQLRLLPPSETAAATPAPAPAPAQSAAPAAQTAANAAGSGAAAAAAAEESRRLLDLRNAELQRLQEQAAAAPVAETPPAEAAAPGVELESEQLFADETAPPEPAAPAAEAPVEAAPAPAPTPAPVAQAQPSGSSLLGWLLSPILWIGLGVAALLFSALWFVRRRRQEAQDVTGRWEALESESDADSESRDTTERLRRAAPEQTIVVEEQQADVVRPSRAEAAPAVARAIAPRAGASDETLSSQTVINLDQADAIAEADFHIAYGLYDQAAELVQKALDAAPGRRDLKLKLLEVFFMWGNKEAFLKAAEDLRADVGAASDPDWDKVVIMGRQICPDERLFTEATTGAGSVDVDLEAGDSPLDLAFDDGTSVDEPVASASADELDFNFEADDTPAPPTRPAARPAPLRDFSDDSLDIGAKTAAGLEAALFEPEDSEDEDTGQRTTPDVAAFDSLAVTQESPTIERPRSSDWATAESPTLQSAADAPTVETPTLETPAARSGGTGATKTMAIPGRTESPTVEQPALASTSDFTAEIDLDDLGLDLKDIEGLPSDLGDLPSAGGSETDTREQRALRADDALLSATGVTKVLDSDDDFDASNTSILEDQDATLLAPGFDDGTLTGTEVLEGRQERDDETGSTSLVRSLRQDDGIDLDLEDLTLALHGADTVEQPRATSFSRDVFGGGDTPLDIDVGADLLVDDEPTGTEEVSPLDPQTMTEIGTKLDLARAYIDMGDPEGARSILEEVLDEGDTNQRREAQGLMDVLSA